MQIEIVKDIYAGAINTVEIGETQAPKRSVKTGGESTMPFLFSEGAMPNRPVVAMEVLDCEPLEWPNSLTLLFGGAVKDPVRWAEMCVSEFGADLICVRLQGTHPDYGNKTGEEAVSTVKGISEKVNSPMIVIGCGSDDKDNEVLPKVSQALKGRNCLLGTATQDNYKTIAATCLADGHSLVAESPIDINIAKQLNILVSDMGFDTKRIVMHPTTASLGYGMEYVYSIMERSRLAAFSGDKMLAMPFILFVGQEVWRVKEAKEFGETQGVNWEISTAVSMIQAGADILVMRHPQAAETVRKYIDIMMRRQA